MNPLRDHWKLALVVALYVAVAVLYGATIPIFESPDENGHYAYIHELTEGRGLPVQGTPSGERVTGYVASHPPLYYALSAAATFWVPDDVDFLDWAWRNPYHANGYPGSVGNKNFLVHTAAEAFPWRGTPLTIHVARLVSTLLGALAVAGTYGTAWELGGGQRRQRHWLALGAAALTAFTPMLVFTGARVSNDAAVAAFGALVIWGAARLAVRGLSHRGIALLGVALGLAVLSKLSGVTLAPAVALALVLDAARSSQFSPRNLRPALRPLLINSLILFAAAALVCGWWFGRNAALYGEVMGVDAWLSHTETVRAEPIGILAVIPQLEGLEVSYWAMFGWFNVPVAAWMYRMWWVLVRLAVIGLFFLLLEQWTRRRMPLETQAGLVVVSVSFLLVFGSVYRFIMIVLGAQGRYLFPAIAAASTLLMLGLTHVWQRALQARSAAPLALLLAGSHLAATLAALFLFVLPAYALPRSLTEAELPPDLTRFDVTVAGTPLQLVGGRIDAGAAQPGDRVPVYLYWRAQAPAADSYVAHVRLLGRDGERVAGFDGYPGGGALPTSLWEPGVIYSDRYLLPVEAGAEAPALMALEAGLRRQGEEALPLLIPSGEPWPGTLLLDVVPLRPAEPPSEQVDVPVGAQMGTAIHFVGAALSPARAAPGATLTVTLVWRTEATPPADYTAFVHLVDAQGHLVAQVDAPPLDGAYPTSWWAPGDVVRSPHRLALPPSLPPGSYRLQAGLYDPAAAARVTATDAEGNRFPDDVIPLTTLEVR
ncbi:MAG: glycosyltransferase family 39 protein [Anaerolineae bacterium]|nr:glycosyltransferase family 39 protein [Anaerolineae bacterium]